MDRNIKHSSKEHMASKNLLTPLIFSPFGIKYQKEEKKKRNHSSLSESTQARPATWVCEVKRAERRGGDNVGWENIQQDEDEE